MDEHQASVHQVKKAVGSWVRPDVMTLDLVGSARTFKPRGIEVGRQQVAIRPCDDPGRHACTSGPYLPDAPAGRESDGVRALECRRVEQFGECVEALARFGLLVVEQIVITSHVQILGRYRSSYPRPAVPGEGSVTIMDATGPRDPAEIRREMLRASHLS